MNVIDIVLRLVAAGAFCGVIGYEREVRHKPAGLRTNILIGMGTALFTIAAILILKSEGGSVSQVVAQVLPGVGFLGAGSIIQARGNVIGLTTAATIWMVAAIGVVCGLGEYVVAAIGTVLALVALVLLRGVHVQEEAEMRGRKE
jgi:putative Mg2+ transporter-C (MgtC) family protein